MKNFEKYIDVIENYKGCISTLCHVYRDLMGNENCNGLLCSEECFVRTIKWLLEEYKEPIKLSHDEYVILKNLHSNIKWIARNKNGDVKLFTDKPCKYQGCNCWSYKSWEYLFYLYNDLFQFIKWEDEEPYEIAKLIADYEKENENEV